MVDCCFEVDFLVLVYVLHLLLILFVFGSWFGFVYYVCGLLYLVVWLEGF